MSSFILELIFLAVLVISGLMNMVAILNITGGNEECKTRWIWMAMIKIVIAIFYTRILDLIVLSAFGEINQMKLSHNQDYITRTIKFVLLLAAFAIGTYSKILREDITNNFSENPKFRKERSMGIKEPLLEEHQG